MTPKQQTARLDGFVPPERPKIPSVVIHCVLEVEKRGLSQPGAYESGVRRVVDLLQKFLEVLSQIVLLSANRCLPDSWF